jgi:flavin reductase (DIM6/NTAB) family NADH-FMN oxidoreductase RutF
MNSDDAFHSLVSNLHYPMYIVTAAADGERDGCLVGFATQASIDPPRLLVLLSKSNRTFRVAQSSPALAVHFLSRANQGLAALFGQETGDDVDKFASCEWREGPDGLPLLSGTRGWMVGTIIERFDAGDHVPHLLTVMSAEIDRPGEPLDFQTVRGLHPGHPA